MEIIEIDIDLEQDRMYCPSTDEIIFAPDLEELNGEAEAFIGYWHDEVLYNPEIKDETLKNAWHEFRDNLNEDDEDFDVWDAPINFLAEYDNPEWLVYKCTTYEIACGPVSSTVYHVVKADTVIEKDPRYVN